MAQDILKNIYLFKDLTPQELKQVEELSKQEMYTPGDEIFTQGDKATALYIIRFGSVRVQQKGQSDNINLATMGTGSHFGEMAFLDGETRSATVTAVEKTEIVYLDYDKLDTLLSANKPMAVKFYKALATFICGRLRVTTLDLSFAREKNLRHF